MTTLAIAVAAGTGYQPAAMTGRPGPSVCPPRSLSPCVIESALVSSAARLVSIK
jgi:hypothetical protein